MVQAQAMHLNYLMVDFPADNDSCASCECVQLLARSSTSYAACFVMDNEVPGSFGRRVDAAPVVAYPFL